MFYQAFLSATDKVAIRSLVLRHSTGDLRGRRSRSPWQKVKISRSKVQHWVWPWLKVTFTHHVSLAGCSLFGACLIFWGFETEPGVAQAGLQLRMRVIMTLNFTVLNVNMSLLT